MDAPEQVSIVEVVDYSAGAQWTSSATVSASSWPVTSSWWNGSSDDVDAYLSLVLGPKHLPADVIVPLTVAYVLLFVTGVVGNVAVCVVIVRNTAMHTATNCYLFSLAVSDLTVLLLGTPFPGTRSDQT